MRRVLVPRSIASEPPASGSVIREFYGQTMGTTWSARVADQGEYPHAEIQRGIQQELDGVVTEMSHWLSDSDLGRFNQAPAGTWQVLPKAFFTVLSYALSVAAESDGAFNPAAGRLVNLWGFGPAHRHDEPGFTAPAADVVHELLGKNNWQRIELDSSTRRARQPGGALLDLSAIAKGYGVDQVARYLQNHGIDHYLIEVGGELRGAGMKPDEQPWWVTLEQPPRPDADETGETVLALHGLAVATSGDYRRYFHLNGKRYPHTLDPRTGYPITHAVASVTVVHKECMAADALSTVLTVLGVEDGLRFAEERGLAARFLTRCGNGFVEQTTSGFRDMLQ